MNSHKLSIDYLVEGASSWMQESDDPASLMLLSLKKPCSNPMTCAQQQKVASTGNLSFRSSRSFRWETSLKGIRKTKAQKKFLAATGGNVDLRMDKLSDRSCTTSGKELFEIFSNSKAIKNIDCAGNYTEEQVFQWLADLRVNSYYYILKHSKENSNKVFQCQFSKKCNKSIKGKGNLRRHLEWHLRFIEEQWANKISQERSAKK